MFVEKRSDFSESFPGFRSLIVELVLRMRFAFEDLQQRIHARFPQFAVHANGIAQEQIAGAGHLRAWLLKEADRRLDSKAIVPPILAHFHG